MGKRKEYNVQNPRLKEFTERFRDLVDNHGGVSKVSELTKISRPTINFWYNGERTPDAISLKKLSETFGISVDYMLGLSPVSSRDENIQAAAVTTGLSEKSINQIRLIAKDMGSRRKEFDLKAALDDFINNEQFLTFVTNYWDFQGKSECFNYYLDLFVKDFHHELGLEPEKPIQCAAKAALGDYDDNILLYERGKEVLKRREEMQFSYFKLEKALHSIVSAEQKEV